MLQKRSLVLKFRYKLLLLSHNLRSVYISDVVFWGLETCEKKNRIKNVTLLETVVIKAVCVWIYKCHFRDVDNILDRSLDQYSIVNSMQPFMLLCVVWFYGCCCSWCICGNTQVERIYISLFTVMFQPMCKFNTVKSSDAPKPFIQSKALSTLYVTSALFRSNF